MGNSFFLVFLTTILVTRLFIFLYPISAPTLGSFRIHHYMYGLIGIVFGILIHSVPLYAIGFGLFVDELTYLLIGGKTHADNYSKVSLTGTLFFIILVYILKDYLVRLF